MREAGRLGTVTIFPVCLNRAGLHEHGSPSGDWYDSMPCAERKALRCAGQGKSRHACSPLNGHRAG